MITLTVQNHSHFAAITFPCSENEMEKKLECLTAADRGTDDCGTEGRTTVY